MPMRNLVLIRGVPGCGKTTIADMLSWFKSSVTYCTDDMFMVDGEYKFDPSKLPEYHAATLSKVKDAMIDAIDAEAYIHDTVIVHNTFTQEWEMKPYFDLAKELDWKVHTIIVENRHGSKNVHGVPEEAIDRMKERFEVIL